MKNNIVKNSLLTLVLIGTALIAQVISAQEFRVNTGIQADHLDLAPKQLSIIEILGSISDASKYAKGLPPYFS